MDQKDGQLPDDPRWDWCLPESHDFCHSAPEAGLYNDDLRLWRLGLDRAAPRFRVTHPFHPLFGQLLELAAQAREWGEERVYYRDSSGRMRADADQKLSHVFTSTTTIQESETKESQGWLGG